MTALSPVVQEGPYFHDLLAQADALRAVRISLETMRLEATLLEKWRSGKFARVVLTGMGSSLHALYPLHRKLCATGVDAHWIETAELLLGFEPWKKEDTLLVAVSQSGESAEIVSLLQGSAKFGHVIGVTNSENSTLGKTANTRLLLQAGLESTVSCKTYLNTLAALHWLGAQLLDSKDVAPEIETAENAVRLYLNDWREHVAGLLPLLEGVQNIFVTGRGDSLATAGTGGLILKESTRRHAEGMSAAAFRHGPLEMADASVLVLIFEGDEVVAPLHRRLAADITRGGGKAALISSRPTGPSAFQIPEVPPALQPIVEILPVQMLSLALAARGGFEAGRFQRASKITNIS